METNPGWGTNDRNISKAALVSLELLDSWGWVFLEWELVIRALFEPLDLGMRHQNMGRWCEGSLGDAILPPSLNWCLGLVPHLPIPNYTTACKALVFKSQFLFLKTPTVKADFVLHAWFCSHHLLFCLSHSDNDTNQTFISFSHSYLCPFSLATRYSLNSLLIHESFAWDSG